MHKKTIQELGEEYNLELKRIEKEVIKHKARIVLLQFPDGLKPYATAIVDELETKCNAEFIIWLGSCFGACDTPNLGDVKVDMVIQFGHTAFKKFNS